MVLFLPNGGLVMTTVTRSPGARARASNPERIGLPETEADEVKQIVARIHAKRAGANPAPAPEPAPARLPCGLRELPSEPTPEPTTPPPRGPTEASDEQRTA